MPEYTLDDLLYLMSRLRDPQDGCPWDLVQDFSTIAPHTIEESYELEDAIVSGNFQQIKEELGDVLFQVVFHAQLGNEQNHFNFSDIVSTLISKLIRRHPHVFPDGTLRSRVGQQQVATEDIKRNWESIKTSERQAKQQSAVLDDVPLALPALARAAKLQKRAAAVGFDWDDVDQVLMHLKSEIEELLAAREQQSPQSIEEEMGDVLFCAVNIARHLKIEPETALRKANRKFEQRFRFIEEQLSLAHSSPADASLELMDELWEKAKQSGF
ncbi:nucleoside triphosphate pyrophosphohydrolase [Oceanicoccus sp. KOV_DT_Chl]|uniref:nucleoside triphosphate pyrophosphohydrolase n=1 Tax=Oceanicoccus sp. KOV_DT_Chl TaxID=1904639 RepID=UPI00190EC453|nr:nucleoside triphosphate pyrophosphohydrolase [Oceanicoccus sp. KOV_DT_Chl]